MTKRKAPVAPFCPGEDDHFGLPRRMMTEPLKSTVLLIHNCPSDALIAFSSSIGQPMNGAGQTDVICSTDDTNVRVASQLVDEPMIVREVRFEIPRTAAARFQFPLPCGLRTAHELRSGEVEEIVNKTLLSFCVGGDRPFLRRKLSEAEMCPPSPVSTLWRGRFVLAVPVTIGRIERYWVELSWPSERLQFRPICTNAGIFPRIPISIYLVP